MKERIIMGGKTLSQRFVAARWPEKFVTGLPHKHGPRPMHLDALANAIIDAAERKHFGHPDYKDDELDGAVARLFAALTRLESGDDSH